MSDFTDDKDIKFVMKTGAEIRKVLISQLNKYYGNDQDKMKVMFMNTLTNSMINILNDVSTDENGFQHNLSTLMQTCLKFVKKEGLTPVVYNIATDELTGKH